MARKYINSRAEPRDPAAEFEARTRDEIGRYRASAKSHRQNAQEDDRVADALERSLRRLLRNNGKGKAESTAEPESVAEPTLDDTDTSPPSSTNSVTDEAITHMEMARRAIATLSSTFRILDVQAAVQRLFHVNLAYATTHSYLKRMVAKGEILAAKRGQYTKGGLA